VIKISKKTSLALTLIVAALFISTASIASAQYQTEETINITIGDQGTFRANEPNVGIVYFIQGTPGTTGTVTATAYNGNPQATAEVPTGVLLTKFVAVVFNTPSQDFTQATLTFKLTDYDVAGLQAPFVIYKYNADTNSYVKLEGAVDKDANTITVTTTGTENSLFAMGGTPVSTTPKESSFLWIAAVGAVAIIVVVVVLGLWKFGVRIVR
jgi:hypothetical protein